LVVPITSDDAVRRQSVLSGGKRCAPLADPHMATEGALSGTIEGMGSDGVGPPEHWSRREQILSTAASLFWLNGFDATSMAQLAEAVGIRKPSLYFYVDRKEALLYEISRESIRLASEAVSRAVPAEAQPDAALAAFIEAHITSLLGDASKMHATMLIDTRALRQDDRQDITALRDSYEQIVGEVLRVGQKSGIFRSDIAEKMLRLSLFNLLNWTIFWYSDRGALSPFEIGRMLTTIFLDGVAIRGDGSQDAGLGLNHELPMGGGAPIVPTFAEGHLPGGLHSDSPRMQMLLAAASHFRSKGYAATTTRTLAEALGMQKATLYHHFKRKSDVLYEISIAALSELYDQVSAEIQAVTVAEDRIPALIRAHLQAALGIRDVYSTMATEFRSLRGLQQQEVRRSRSEYRQLLTSVLSAGQRAGIVRIDISAKNLSLVLLNLLGGTVLWYRPDGELNASEIAYIYSRLFLSGVRESL
jgi:AcrR family transcriptional regulator